MLAAVTNIITSVVGNGSSTFNGENKPGTSTFVNSPTGLYGDTLGNLYYCDKGNNRVRVLKNNGLVTTVAGSANSGDTGENGRATSAKLSSLSDVFVDTSGNVFFSDSSNCKIKRVDAITGVLTTLVNTLKNCIAFTPDGSFGNVTAVTNLIGLWQDTLGAMYFADPRNYRIRVLSTQRRVTTIAGNGQLGLFVPATNAMLYSPRGVVGDSVANVYIADSSNNLIRKVLANDGTNVPFAGTRYTADSGDRGPASLASINGPKCLTIDTIGNIYFTLNSNRVRMVNTTNIITTLIGGSTKFSTENATASSSLFSSIQALYVDSFGHLYIGDNNFAKIVKYNKITKRLTTYAGTGTAVVSGDGGLATVAGLKSINGITGDGVNKMFFCDSNRIRMINMVTNIITSIAGSMGFFPNTCANGISVGSTNALTIDTLGRIYFGDNQFIRLITPTANASCWSYRTFMGNTRYSGTLTDYSPVATSNSLDTINGLWINPNGTLYIVEGNPFRVRSTIYVSAPTGQPTNSPSGQPSRQPTRQPTGQPSRQPTGQPSGQPSRQPTGQPSREPTSQPSTQPSSLPTGQPSSQPMSQPTGQPSGQPSRQPTGQPSRQPTSQPSTQPSGVPTGQPSSQPVSQPTGQPSGQPSRQPTDQPSSPPTSEPSILPSSQPTTRPSQQPSVQPSSVPMMQPSQQPVSYPSALPSSNPTSQPSIQPSLVPTGQPSPRPTFRPSLQPSSQPSSQPIAQPSGQPSAQPTSEPSSQPTTLPSTRSSSQPTSQPSQQPFSTPTVQPSQQPMSHPSSLPFSTPTSRPTNRLETFPSPSPTTLPTNSLSTITTVEPSILSIPTSSPLPSTSPTHSTLPSLDPTILSAFCPSITPSNHPLTKPTTNPQSHPTSPPTTQPTGTPICLPTISPTSHPSGIPTETPASSHCPSSFPTRNSSSKSTSKPTLAQTSIKPSSLPSVHPSVSVFAPTVQPSSFTPSFIPSLYPTDNQSLLPSFKPSPVSSIQSTVQQSSQPTSKPSAQPISRPTAQPSSIPSQVLNQPFALSKLLFPSIVSIMLPQSVNREFKIQLFLLNPLNRQKPIYSNISASSSIAVALSNLQVPAKVATDYVIYGKRGGLSPLSMIIGGSSGSDEDYSKLPSSGLYLEINNARSVSRVGDLNQDGYEELGIGNPLKDQVYVLFGVRGERRYGEGFTIYAESLGDYLGWSIARAGDFNADGYDDMIVSAMMRSTVYIIFGRGSDKAWNDVFLSRIKVGECLKIVGSSGSLAGIGVSSAGDFNGDGRDDEMFTATSASAGSSGGGNMIYVLYGGNQSQSPAVNNALSIDKLTNKQMTQIISPPLSFAGLSLASVGDVNGDGIDDIAIGSVPYQGGYTTQVTYIVYGKRSRESSSGNLRLSNMSREDGVKVMGGGFMVSGAGDVDGDGMADVLISSYYGWANQVGGYLVTLPLKNAVSRKPSMSPSVNPTSIVAAPSNLPSSQPSWALDAPSLFPSFVPSGPTISPTYAPSNPTELPTSHPSYRYSAKPSTLRPSTRQPTIRKTASPSFIRTSRPSSPPTFNPSYFPTMSPTFIPSIKPTAIPTRTPSRKPSARPTRSPTTKPSLNLQPSSSPSQSPTLSLSQPIVTIYVDSKGNQTIKGGGNGVTARVRQYVINSRVDVSLASVGKSGRTIFTIYAAPNVTITIHDFEVKDDIIDFRSYDPGMTSLDHLRYSTFPLTILLKQKQKIILADEEGFRLSERNFMWSSSGSKDPTTSTDSVSSDWSSTANTLTSSNILTWLIVFGGMMGGTFILFQLKDMIGVSFSDYKTANRALKQLDRQKYATEHAKTKAASYQLNRIVEEEEDDDENNESIHRVKMKKDSSSSSEEVEEHDDNDNNDDQRDNDSDSFTRQRNKEAKYHHNVAQSEADESESVSEAGSHSSSENSSAWASINSFFDPDAFSLSYLEEEDEEEV